MKVLAAIDNKPSSQAIIDSLLKMHWHVGTEIHVITVLPKGVEYGDGNEAPSGSVEEIESLAVELNNALSQCEVTFVARHGDPVTTILEVAEQIKTDLIVVGSNCKNTLERLLVGSVSLGVLNRAHCPVVVAKTPCCLARDASPGFKNILIPIDNSVFSDAAVRWLCNLDWGQNTNFIVAAVVEEDTDMDQVEDSLKRRSTDLSRFLNTNNVLIETGAGDVCQSIVELAKKYYADLIVMGSHGHKGLQKLILGSASQAVLHAAPCAVAIVRGIVPADRNWYKTGHFDKVKLLGSFSNESGGSSGDSAHIMPSGM
jgi:nucleotide-binding universal stress UspA family protein